MMGKCEFCRGEKPVLSSIKQYSDRIESIVGEIRGNELYFSILEQTADVDGNPKMFLADGCKIQYCPKCGRELSEAEWMSEIDKKLSEALIRVGCLEGVRAAHMEDDVAIRGGHFNDYLLVAYLGQLLERGKMEIKVKPDSISFLLKLLHMDNKKENVNE